MAFPLICDLKTTVSPESTKVGTIPSRATALAMKRYQAPVSASAYSGDSIVPSVGGPSLPRLSGLSESQQSVSGKCSIAYDEVTQRYSPITPTPPKEDKTGNQVRAAVRVHLATHSSIGSGFSSRRLPDIGIGRGRGPHLLHPLSATARMMPKSDAEG